MERAEEEGETATMSGSSVSSSLFSRATLSQRIVSIEYYMTAPVKEFDNMYSEFRSSSVKRVPVIRIFGSTPAGQKMCANIHGVYPYITILDDETVEGFEYRLATALDEAINESVNSNKFAKPGPNSFTQHVFKVMRIVGRTFYGYRSNNEVFLRIFFYNPLILKKAVDLLQSGSIFGRHFQPYEAHIPYSLQFMIDYSLYGMNFVHYSSVKFRRNLKGSERESSYLTSSQCSSGSTSSIEGYINPDEINSSALGPAQLTKLTRCELEIDVIASDILIDTNSSGKAMSVNPGIDCIWKDEIERRRQQGVENCSQITIPDSQQRPQSALLETEDKYQQILWQKIDSMLGGGSSEICEGDSFNVSQASMSIDESEHFPSSQVPDHLSGSSNKAADDQCHPLSQEEHDFIRLLENMAAEVDTGQVEYADENLIEQENENFLEADPNDDGLWDDSFLNSSMLEKISDAEASHEESLTEVRNAVRPQSPKIFQCDGQVDDSDSSDGTPAANKKQEQNTTRVSRRISERRQKKSNPQDNERSKVSHKGAKSIKSTASPANRLSLSRRRLSRSQEVKHQNSATSTSLKISSEPLSSSKRKSLSTNALCNQPVTSVEQGKLTSNDKKSVSEEVGSEELKKAKLKNFPTAGFTSSKSPFILLQKIDTVLGQSPLKIDPNQMNLAVPASVQGTSKTAGHNNSSSKNTESSQEKKDIPAPVVRSKRIAARKNRLSRNLTQELHESEKKESTVNANKETLKTNKVKSTPVGSTVSASFSATTNDTDTPPILPTATTKKKRLGISRRIKTVSPVQNVVKKLSNQSNESRLEKEDSIVGAVENLEKTNVEKPVMVIEKHVPSNIVPKTTKQLVDIGVTCKPALQTAESQTNNISMQSSSVQASPLIATVGSQVSTSTTDAASQTVTLKVSTETQTDVIVPLCLCQCTCVRKDQEDKSVDVQDDLKPIMENKKIQVDNVDMISRARSARFTTPQNKIRYVTPSRSPEKRKTLTDSPRRRPMTTPTSSRYLSALLLKTPTSHQKSRSFRRSPATPTDSLDHVENLTPGRESKEGFLIHSIRKSSMSPRKRTTPVRPRNLEAETSGEAMLLKKDLKDLTVKDGNLESPAPCPTETLSSNSYVAGTSPEEFDLSVNSIYEYEEDPSIVNTPTGPEGTPVPSSETSLSVFQRKRILSKYRSKTRLEKRKAANLEANRAIPDTFGFEYEPLKQPASYKSTMKWLEAERNRISTERIHSDSVVKQANVFENESSDEEIPPMVKLFGGGTDGEDVDDCGTSESLLATEEDKMDIKPFTPEFMPSSQSNNNTSSNETPRSILRPGGSSRRQKSSSILKRKIHWEDDGPAKKVKTESDCEFVKESENEMEMSMLTNDSMSSTANISELDGPSFKNALGLENSMSNLQDAKALHQFQFLTTMCVEIHCVSRNGLTPDPSIDPITAIFVLISSDYPDGFRKPKEFSTVLIMEDKLYDNESIQPSTTFKSFSNEFSMFEEFMALVRFWDPDILVGYEVEKFSFGYLIQRGFQIGVDVVQELSRVLPIVVKQGENAYQRRTEEWNGAISGRIVLNLWRLLRHEIAVQSYTFENAGYHILRRRVYKFSFKTLNSLWLHKINRYRVIQYYMIRVKGTKQIMDKLDLINRTSELARLFGIQFYEVLSRGSQFRVESMMLRATKPLDLIAPSPTVIQRVKMRAPEYLPLILEPRSNYYTDPVAVLDFQSLYPSMMMAYNYDYASVLGRVESMGSMDRFSLGCLDHQISPSELLRLKDHIHISPAGVAFVDKSITQGILPEMLKQILETRQMVKRAMKRWKTEGASLQKVLDSRQLGLKLIANVTYGYTSANFSGRMPCVEIADSVVSKGRETLQRAIDHVKQNQSRWGAEVVYGDTDSLFILFRGKSRDEAFKLAYEIADEVTQANPKPVKLKFEKVYQPCILQSKKRYVGYAYETPEQVKPIYDAKGIETVRRDGCPAVKKILEKALHVLFTTDNRVKVQNYVSLQFEKICKGRVSMQDYIFAREFRGRAGYKPAACVPSLEIAKRLSEHDPRAEPLTSERVPYVVVYGNPTLPLIKLVRTPEEFLENSSMRLNAHYYIEKAIIPALNRCLMRAGMDATKWYLQMPRKYLRNILDHKPKGGKGQGTLDDYILHQNCLKCDGKAEKGLCNNCLSDETSTVIYLQEVLRNSKSKLNSCVEICTSCAGEARSCVSIDCPILHKLTRYDRDQAHMKTVERELLNLEW